MDYNKWDYEYHNKQIIDIKKELTDSQLEIIRKLGIEIKDKIYTEYEYECLKLKLLEYMESEDGEEYPTKSLDGTNVSKEEFNSLIKRVDEINEKM